MRLATDPTDPFFIDHPGAGFIAAEDATIKIKRSLLLNLNFRTTLMAV
jgi:hypothetical protein